MNKKPANTDTTRECHRCHQALPATTDFFLRDKSRPLGLSYECKKCHSERKKGRDRRKERWSMMTDEQKLKARARHKKYNLTAKGRAFSLKKAYEKIDSCDLSTDEIVAIIRNPCHYCGCTDRNRGLDRIDNSKPHIKGNVLPACAACNIARGDRFSVEEMVRLGNVIREIFKDRIYDQARNEGHL